MHSSCKFEGFFSFPFQLFTISTVQTWFVHDYCPVEVHHGSVPNPPRPLWWCAAGQAAQKASNVQLASRELPSMQTILWSAVKAAKTSSVAVLEREAESFSLGRRKGFELFWSFDIGLILATPKPSDINILHVRSHSNGTCTLFVIDISFHSTPIPDRYRLILQAEISVL